MTQTRMIPPTDAVLLRQRTEVFSVWRLGNRVYKQQPKYLTDNEFHFLFAFRNSIYCPLYVRQEDIETISMEYIPEGRVVNPEEFMYHFPHVINDLREANIRHGDLTEYAIRIRDDRPYIIDFSESRWYFDPMPSKRREADSVLLMRAMKKLCQNQ